MSYLTSTFVVAGFLFGGLLLALEVGRRIGAYRAARAAAAREGIGAMDGAIFGLMGLLVAFTFSGAASRFDSRRNLIIQEANNIGTAYLRLDLLPAGAQPALRELFRDYVDTRVRAYAKLPDVEAARQELAASLRLQGEIWRQAVAGCQTVNSPASVTLVLSAINNMIDITTKRTMATQIHPPRAIFLLLWAATLASALIAGYAMGANGTRSRIHMYSFAAVLALAIFVILNLEYPRLGLIRIDKFDQVLVDLRKSM